jgi:hypothetical protein
VIERSVHRVTVWAGGKNGIPVTCACGWKTYASTKHDAYAKKATHLRTA